MSMLWQKFTERAKRVVILAQEEAAHAGEPYVSPEHLLLGLIDEGDSVATKVLERLEVRPAQVRKELERQIGGRGFGRLNNNDVTLDPRMKRVLDYSYDEARQSNTNYIGTEHLLLGLIREGDGIAFRTLTKLGVELASARREVISYLGGEVVASARRPPRKALQLQDALRAGDLRTLIDLLGDDAPVDSVDEYGRTALGLAAATGRWESAKLLLDHGASANQVDAFGRTPLHYAIENGHENVARLLQAHGAEVDMPDGAGETPLYKAAASRHPNLVQLLQDAGASMGVVEAALLGDREQLDQLLLSSGSVDTRNEAGMTALMAACKGGHAELVSALLDRGADVNAEDKNGKTPLTYAAESTSTEIAGTLLKHGAELNHGQSRQEALAAAIAYSNLTMLSFLLDSGVDPTAAGAPAAALWIALSQTRSTEALDLLLAHGVAINQPDVRGEALLNYAVVAGQLAWARALLDRGADPNRRDSEGTAPLHSAVRGGRPPMVRLLLERGAQVEDRDPAGHSSLILAVMAGDAETARLLLSAGANASVAFKELSALEIATLKGSVETMRALLESGAQITPEIRLMMNLPGSDRARELLRDYERERKDGPQRSEDA